MRTPVELRSVDRKIYKDFCEKNPDIRITYDSWVSIIYGFNESFRDYILETGDVCKLPWGFGEFTVKKKKRKQTKKPVDGKEYINLPVDWKRSKEKGKKVYIMNYHTEGFFYGWRWFKRSAKFEDCQVWYFKPSRVSSRLIAHYLKTDPKYQDLYQEWR